MDPDHSQNIVLLITNKVQLKSSSLKSSSLFSRLSGNSWKCCFFIFFIKQSIIRVSWFIIPTYGVEWKNIQTFNFLTFWGRNKIQWLHGLYFSRTVILADPKWHHHRQCSANGIWWNKVAMIAVYLLPETISLTGQIDQPSFFTHKLTGQPLVKSKFSNSPP